MEMREIPTIHQLFPYLGLVKDSGTRDTQSRGSQKDGPAAKKARTDKPARTSAPNQLDAAGLEKQRKEGFLKWNKQSGVSASIKFHYPNAAGESTRVCFNGISQGPFCRFGDKCHGHHLKKLSDILVDKQKPFCKLVEESDGLEFMPGQGPSGN